MCRPDDSMRWREGGEGRGGGGVLSHCLPFTCVSTNADISSEPAWVFFHSCFAQLVMYVEMMHCFIIIMLLFCSSTAPSCYTIFHLSHLHHDNVISILL